jgi:hypothetical protein
MNECKYISRIQYGQFSRRSRDAPFTFAVDLVLREGDVLEFKLET